MNYRVVTSMNHNVVLACDDKTKEKVILMAKGIGFGKKKGDIVSDKGTDRQIFKLWADSENIKPVQEDRSAVEELVGKLVAMAKEQLGVENPNLRDALLDHIQFAVDRLRFGLPIDNPFAHETALLYTREYELASTAVRMIQPRLHVHVGEAEIGFIALHLHSAGRNNPIDRSMRSVQLYKQIMQLLEKRSLGVTSSRRAFLQSLFEMVDAVRHGARFHFPFPLYRLPDLEEDNELVEQICQCVQSSCKLSLDTQAKGYLLLDLERLRQTTGQTKTSH